MADLGQSGVLQVIPPAALEQQLQERAQASAQAAQPQDTQNVQGLASYIKGQYEIFRNHRNTQAGWSDRLLHALRTFNGQYDAAKLADLSRFGGSHVYARLVAQKCRAASSLLRDVYLNAERPWALKAAADPPVPDEILAKINSLLQMEAQMIQQQSGQPPSPVDVDARKRALIEGAQEAAKKKAIQQAKDSEDKIEDILRAGGFYHALAEFLVDLPIFPFACIKGPVVKVVPTVQWPPGGGPPTVQHLPTLTWNRVSPFDVWMTPGVSDIENADVIEKLRVSRAELNDLLDLPGYNHDEIRAVLDEYGRGGLYDNWDTTDAERSVLESRENPAWNRSKMLSMMEFNGNVQGRMLQDYGLAVPDELRDYHVQVWMIGSHVIKANISPSPRQRHPYFITSFEKVPGTPVGNGLTDLLSDIQEVSNATLRSLVNNLSIASGPQVVVDTSRLAPDESGEELYAWKRWRVRNHPYGDNSHQPPVQFYQPQSNSQQLVEVYKFFSEVGDDISAIPKYIGGQAGSGAGRTASGLAMLMGNASKILQTVSANIDRDVVELALTQLTDLILLTDETGLLTGAEKITVQGVNVAIQRETQRQRQMEFLTATQNPLDQKIIGVKGRGVILRSVSHTIGMPGENIVPPDEVLEKMQEQEKQAAQGQEIDKAVNDGVVRGVQAGVSRIATELTAGRLAENAHLPEGQPTHIGTLPQNGGSPGHTNNSAMDLAASQAQGNNNPRRLSGNQMGPTTALTGNQPGPNARPVHGGVG